MFYCLQYKNTRNISLKDHPNISQVLDSSIPIQLIGKSELLHTTSCYHEGSVAVSEDLHDPSASSHPGVVQRKCAKSPGRVITRTDKNEIWDAIFCS